MSEEFKIEDNGEKVTFIIYDPNKYYTVGPSANTTTIYDAKKCSILYSIVNDIVTFHSKDVAYNGIYDIVMKVLGSAEPYKDEIHDKLIEMIESVENEN